MIPRHLLPVARQARRLVLSNSIHGTGADRLAYALTRARVIENKRILI